MGKVTSQQVLEVISNANVVKDVSLLAHDKSLSEQGVDSLDFSSVLFNIEEEFKIKIKDDDVDGLSTIDAIVVYINRKITVK